MSGIVRCCLPAGIITSSSLGMHVLGFGMPLAVVLAVLTGLLTLLASAETQRTIRTWIQHRAETEVAAALAYRIRRQARAATCGWRWTTANAARVRDATAALESPEICLAELMRVTRSGA